MLIQRKPRPLTRETSDFRDDRLFIIACDDTYAPQQYFDRFRLPRVKIHVVPTTDGTSHARQVLNRLKSYEHDAGDELWMVLDTDHCIKDGHVRPFRDALRDAKKSGVNVAVSRSCFEIWLLLHHIDEAGVVNLKNAREVEIELRKVMGEYNKTNVKQEHFSFEAVVEACARAERLDQAAGGGLIPNANTSRVYLLWHAIVAKSLPSQLPQALHPLLEKLKSK